VKGGPGGEYSNATKSTGYSHMTFPLLEINNKFQHSISTLNMGKSCKDSDLQVGNLLTKFKVKLLLTKCLVTPGIHLWKEV
jgi:hypothetical protein